MLLVSSGSAVARCLVGVRIRETSAAMVLRSFCGLLGGCWVTAILLSGSFLLVGLLGQTSRALCLREKWGRALTFSRRLFRTMVQFLDERSFSDDLSRCAPNVSIVSAHIDILIEADNLLDEI